MDVSRDTFILPQVFGANTGTVAGHTVILCGGSLPELVVRKQATAHFIGSADMALPAGGMALLAVISKSRGQRGTLFQIAAPGFQG